MKKDNFILKEYFQKELNQEQLLIGIEKYKKYIVNNPFPLSEKKSTYNSIYNLKRKAYTIGPYSGLSIFEISNRLFSDLVVLEGAKRIFEEPSLVKANKIKGIKLLLSNKNGIDLKINTDKGTVYGEAYNVASSFFKEKTRYTIKKLNKDNNVKKAVLIFNDDAFDEDGKNKEYLKLQISNNDKMFPSIVCDLEYWK